MLFLWYFFLIEIVSLQVFFNKESKTRDNFWKKTKIS